MDFGRRRLSKRIRTARRRWRHSLSWKILSLLIAYQPFTPFGALAVVLATVGLRVFAIPQFDLIADILCKSVLALVAVVVLLGIAVRLRLGKNAKADLRFDTHRAVSRRPLSSGISLIGSNLPPFFSLEISRRFAEDGVAAPRHIIRGRAQEEGKRTLIDTVAFPHRGYWSVPGVEFTLRDAFGLTAMAWESPAAAGVEVHAKTIPIVPLPIVAASSRAGDQLQQSRERSGDLFDIKPYDPSDGTKRILWKTFAKSGQLVVRRPEPAVIPEGEVAIYLIAGAEDDHVAGALQGYIEQLEANQIVILFGTDGMGELANEARAAIKETKTDSVSGGFVTEDESIRRAISRCVWSDAAGTGSDFGRFLRALDAASKPVHNVIVFAPHHGEWFESLARYASNSSVRLTIALVPESLNEEVAAAEIAKRLAKGKWLSALMRHPLQTAFASLSEVIQRRSQGQSIKRSESFQKLSNAVRSSGSELLLVEGQDARR